MLSLCAKISRKRKNRMHRKLIHDAKDVEQYAKLCKSTEGVTFVPAFQGLFAPYWRDDAKAALSGMTLQAGRPEICRAAIEAVAFQVTDILDAMAGDGIKVKLLRVDGGMTVNKLLMQTQADFLGSKLEAPSMGESTALGAAITAGLGGKMFKSTRAI